MNIQIQPMGVYQTNCYIITVNDKDFIIDPGVDATSWVLSHCKNPIAILNTHGHFDHVWSNKEIKEALNIPIYCPKEDAFMLHDDPFGQGTPSSTADVLVNADETFTLEGVTFSYHLFPGHTPGCSVITFDNIMFSGDFIFQNSIGRADFPYSSPADMIKSIDKVLQWEEDFTIYPGHGNATKLSTERRSLNAWKNYL
ncbi:MAG: MBL fold metallo-hydrolase [Campylobacterota bacterium]|nr:MBL fold metallo-hydrolase [Campylobacterota bacterium]